MSISKFGKALTAVSTKIDKVGDVVAAFKELAYTKVLVGVPQAKSSRPYETNEKGERVEGSEITNAELAYIHTHGSPVNNIPPRPFLQPSIEKNIVGISTIQKQIVFAALEGKKAQVKILNNRLGLYAQSKAKEYITEGTNLVPNSPETIARKRAKAYHQKNKKIKAREPKPLIDTGQLLNSIQYVIDHD